MYGYQKVRNTFIKILNILIGIPVLIESSLIKNFLLWPFTSLLNRNQSKLKLFVKISPNVFEWYNPSKVKTFECFRKEFILEIASIKYLYY